MDGGRRESRRATAGHRRRRAPFRRGLWSVVCSLLLLAACHQGDDTYAQIADSGVLRIGVDPTFPPFAAAAGPEVWGLDIDVARALAAELGLEPQFTYFGFDGLYDALATRQVDVLISALVIMPERTQDVAYTDSYFDGGQVLVIPDGSPVSSMADVDGRAVAVELGALGHVAAQARQRRLPDMTIVTHDSTDAALAAVAAGRAAAALVDSVSARLYRRDHPDAGLIRLAAPVVPEPYALAVRIGERTLERRLNGGLQTLRDNGQLEQIITRWVGQ